MGNYKLGDLVWAKMKGFPPWPGIITDAPKEMKKQPTKKNVNYHCIFFFGTKNYGWIDEGGLKQYVPFKGNFNKQGKSVTFREACDAIEDYYQKREEGGEVYLSTEVEAAFDRLVKSMGSNSSSPLPSSLPPKKKIKKDEGASTSEPQDSSKSPDLKPVVKPKQEESALSGTEPLKISRKAGRPKKNVDVPSTSTADSPPPVIKRSSSVSPSPIPPKKKKRQRLFPDSNAPDNTSTQSQQGVMHSYTQPSCSYRKGPGSNLIDRPSVVSRPITPPLNLDTISETLKEKNITPSPLKFGFLGLGIMGSGIVKNLLNSGHKVLVWNRTPEKCDEFIKAGATFQMTPSDVVSGADITFSCVSDPQAAKELVFGNCGVLQEMNSSKAYVEMTGIDADTSVDIGDAITGKGGRYLEAQMQGSKKHAEEGTIVILSAGDRSLYDECHSCFEAFGRSSFFLGDVGNASKMNLVLQLMSGIIMAGLAEGMALADRAGLQQADVLEIIGLTTLSCPLILDKGKAILDGGFSTSLPLQHLQKDLKLSLNLGDQLEQPLPLTASANEVFKHAKRLGYGDHDASAVYIRARF